MLKYSHCSVTKEAMERARSRERDREDDDDDDDDEGSNEFVPFLANVVAFYE